MTSPIKQSKLRVAVLGASGYVGGELLRLLSSHPAVAELRAFSGSHSGQNWSAVHPVFRNATDGQFETPDIGATAEWCDVVYLALPHGQSQQVMANIVAAHPLLVVDTAADFRIHDQDLYTKAYGNHVTFEMSAEFTYGLADVVGDALLGKRRIAAPGCFATATLLALWPLAVKGLLQETPTCFAITGSTGSGTTPKPTTHHPSRGHNFYAYGLSGHRHEAEITEQLTFWTKGAIAGCTLLNHSAPLVRGMYATVRARMTEAVTDPTSLLREVYSYAPFVRVLDQPPEVAAVVGTNFAHLHGVARSQGREVVICCAIDNMVKGAAGQAIQAANIALGLHQNQGLDFPGFFPC